ncbi:hypothetical protein [Rhizobium leguminosarum]|uniref:hypothetical protein n=1 Tax=Rhizobium leguminosarum TaxID=384 RepID=UPI003F9CEA60
MKEIYLQRVFQRRRSEVLGNMRRQSWVALPLFALVLFAFSSCAAVEKYSWCQKLTVEVQTPDGIKTGSSVVESTLTERKGGLPEAEGVFNDYKGEAVVVELAPGRYLFALLKETPRAERIFFPNEAPAQAAPKLKDMVGQSVVLPAKHYPMLVTFKSVADPTSIRLVNPEDLESSFGIGYKLKSITLTITDEPVPAAKISQLLPWLNWPRDEMLRIGGGRTPVRISIGDGILPLDEPDFRRY